MNPSVSVLLVDDHPLFRLGLTSALRARGFETIVVSDGSEVEAEKLLPFDRKGEPWVALLDVRLGAVDGIELCRRIRDLPDPPMVIMLSTFDDAAVLQAAKNAGAFAFLSKEAEADQIVETILASLAGGPSRIRDQDVPEFTRRERDVLRLLCDGLDNKSIAAHLGIAPATAKDHLDNIYGKLGVSTRLNAVRRAVELGLVAARP